MGRARVAALVLQCHQARVDLELRLDRFRGLWYHWGAMTDRRIRLSEEDVELIVAALRSRAAMTRGLRRHRIERLAERLADGRKGNPRWRLGEESQIHEDEIDEN